MKGSSSKRVVSCGSITFANVDGIRGSGRWAALQSLNSCMLNVSESHADSLLQASWGPSSNGWFHLWGAPSASHDQRGVSQHASCSAFWAARRVLWTPADLCHRFYLDARLTASFIWIGDGRRALLVYCLYGPAGARWDSFQCSASRIVYGSAAFAAGLAGRLGLGRSF